MKPTLEQRTISRSVIGKKTRNPGYQPGNHWLDCDRCGATIRSKDARMTWDNLVVCPNDWEPRHPQDFVRSREDRIAVGGAFGARGLPDGSPITNYIDGNNSNTVAPVDGDDNIVGGTNNSRPGCIVGIAIAGVSIIGDEGTGYNPTSTVPEGTFDNSL